VIAGFFDAFMRQQNALDAVIVGVPGILKKVLNR
jgi:hypothetical protein